MNDVTHLPARQESQDRPALRAPAPTGELGSRLRALLPPARQDARKAA